MEDDGGLLPTCHLHKPDRQCEIKEKNVNILIQTHKFLRIQSKGPVCNIKKEWFIVSVDCGFSAG